MSQEPVPNQGTGKLTERSIQVRWQEKNPSVKARVPWDVSHSQNADQTLYVKDTKMYFMAEASTTSLYSDILPAVYTSKHFREKGKRDFIYSPCNLLACISLDSLLPVFLSL